MRTNRTRVRRGTPHRRRGPTRTHGRATVRHQPPRRSTYTRRRNNRRAARTPRPTIGKSFKTAFVAGVVVTVIVAVIAFLARGFPGVQSIRITGGTPSADPVAGQFIYTARTANDAAITLPGVVQAALRQAGLAHQSVELTRVDYAGNVSTSDIDMTPRTGNSPQDPPLKVLGRALPVIDAKISSIETDINTASGTTGGRALYAGLTRADFSGIPVTIISSGIDLADPDDFRSLKWKVPPGDVVAEVKNTSALPALHGPVTFVLVPTAGSQPQLEQAQKNYLKAVWTALLTTAGATSVTFIDAGATAATSMAPSVSTVPVPDLPTTPIPQVPGSKGVTCTVPQSYFVFDTAELIDAAKTIRDLTPCITAALAAHATFALDGWTSYEGPLSAAGQPAFNDPANITLSEQRVQAIADLLVNNLGVPVSDITRTTGHGNAGQPNPDPRSAANRVVVITYTIK
jgi:outer membrane protein OmpA-like peptidoglycan-associated protein